MYTPYDTDDPRPVFEAMATIDRLAEICERDRSIAWDHIGLTDEALDLAEQTISLGEL